MKKNGFYWCFKQICQKKQFLKIFQVKFYLRVLTLAFDVTILISAKRRQTEEQHNNRAQVQHLAHRCHYVIATSLILILQ